MINVQGLPLSRAKELLANEGVAVSCREARSKKGVPDGTDARVIRQTLLEDGRVLLIYAIFRTEPVKERDAADLTIDRN